MKSGKPKTGQVRQHLFDVLQGLKDGTVTPEQAAAYCKTAGRINESLFAEATVMQRQKELGHEIAKLGELEI